MKGDFTRMTFDPKKHYRGVLMQQGRVQLDADWNEQIDIQAHRVETETRDTVGVCGTPVDQPGFTLVVDAATLSTTDQTRLTDAKLLPLKTGDFLIGPGRYYVDGILIENEDYVLYTKQPDYPGFDLQKLPSQPRPEISKVLEVLEGLEIKSIADAGLFQVYLDVWARYVTALDDESIREKALGGPDTATRAKTLWQVKVNKLAADGLNCITAPLPGDESTGQLSARAKPPEDQKNECEVPLKAGYRRLENQLYRVEIHEGGNETSATFKWSRDNASMVTTWKSKNGNDLTVGSGGPDDVLGFAANQWIELSDDTRELQGKPGTLVKLVTAVGQKLTIDPATATGLVELDFFQVNPKLRRWDTIAASGGTRKVNDKDTPDGFIRLEDGVEIKFETGDYRTGDYWLIPARTATGTVEWPIDASGDPIAQAKHGIYHHTCPLGLLSFDATTGNELTVKEDFRSFFPPLTDLTCLYYVGGDGQEAAPGKTLPYDLQVGVANGQHPIKDARVRFTVSAGEGSVSGSQPIRTNGEGVTTCQWTLGNNSDPQQVMAELLDVNNQRIHLPIIFNAQFAQGDVTEPGIHVTGIVSSDRTQFHNDTEFSADLLAQGLKITCDEYVHALSVRSRYRLPEGGPVISPTVYITLDLPYPFNSADRELWGNDVIAFKPIILAANVNSDNNVIYWSPDKTTQTWLVKRLFPMMAEFKRGQRILAHLTLKGNFIWGEKWDKKNNRYLDGEVFGAEDKDTNRVPFVKANLPSGNERRGGDLEMWFWLVAPQRRVVLLGNPKKAVFEALSPKRQMGLVEAFSLALNRQVLRDVVPPEFKVDVSLPFDLPQAKKLVVRYRLQGIEFTAWSKSLLSDANEQISKMISPLEISMDTLAVDENTLETAIAAGIGPEAVLVDADFADQLNKIGYTLEIVTL